MTDPVPLPPLLVVTLPGRTAEELRAELAVAAQAGADLVEIRLDRLSPGEFTRLERVHDLPLMHPWVPAIGTLRSRSEGGEGPDDPVARAAILQRALELFPFSFLDLEVSRDGALRETFRQDNGRPLSLVGSTHFPGPVPVGPVVARLEETLASFDVAKVVLPADGRYLVEELLPALRPFKDRPYVVHSVGGLGSVLRVLSRRLGMEWVFGALPEGPPDRPSPRPVEPSQVPADRLRRFLDAPGDCPWYAVVGRPLGHTLSPYYQNLFFEATEVCGLYVPLEPSASDELPVLLRALRAYGLAGVNVTRPYKTQAASLAEKADEDVELSGAANTLRLPPTGPIEAFNTDVQALRRRLEEGEQEGLWDGGRMLVVGTGGAARAAILAGLGTGARVRVLSRSPERARALAAEFPAEAVQAALPETLTPFPLVVHATPAGQSAGPEDFPPLAPALGKGSWLLDLVYRPILTRLRDWTAAAGARYEDGTRILLYQARESFERFTGGVLPEATFGALLPEGVR